MIGWWKSSSFLVSSGGTALAQSSKNEIGPSETPLLKCQCDGQTRITENNNNNNNNVNWKNKILYHLPLYNNSNNNHHNDNNNNHKKQQQHHLPLSSNDI